MKEALAHARSQEESPLGQWVLEQLLDNCPAGRGRSPSLCQDTGMVVVFAQIGQDVHFTGGNWEEAVAEGVRKAYVEGNLRKSVVSHPLWRENSGDNTPL